MDCHIPGRNLRIFRDCLVTASSGDVEGQGLDLLLLFNRSSPIFTSRVKFLKTLSCCHLLMVCSV